MATRGRGRGVSSRTGSSSQTRDSPNRGGPGALGRAVSRRAVRCPVPAASGAGAEPSAGRGRPGAAPARREPPCQDGPEPGKGVRGGPGRDPLCSAVPGVPRGGAARPHGQGRLGRG